MLIKPLQKSKTSSADIYSTLNDLMGQVKIEPTAPPSSPDIPEEEQGGGGLLPALGRTAGQALFRAAEAPVRMVEGAYDVGRAIGNVANRAIGVAPSRPEDDPIKQFLQKTGDSFSYMASGVDPNGGSQQQVDTDGSLAHPREWREAHPVANLASNLSTGLAGFGGQIIAGGGLTALPLVAGLNTQAKAQNRGMALGQSEEMAFSNAAPGAALEGALFAAMGPLSSKAASLVSKALPIGVKGVGAGVTDVSLLSLGRDVAAKTAVDTAYMTGQGLAVGATEKAMGVNPEFDAANQIKSGEGWAETGLNALLFSVLHSKGDYKNMKSLSDPSVAPEARLKSVNEVAGKLADAADVDTAARWYNAAVARVKRGEKIIPSVEELLNPKGNADSDSWSHDRVALARYYKAARAEGAEGRGWAKDWFDAGRDKPVGPDTDILTGQHAPADLTELDAHEIRNEPVVPPELAGNPYSADPFANAPEQQPYTPQVRGIAESPYGAAPQAGDSAQSIIDGARSERRPDSPPQPSQEEVVAASEARLKSIKDMAAEVKANGGTYSDFSSMIAKDPLHHGFVNEKGKVDVPSILTHLNNTGYNGLRELWDMTQIPAASKPERQHDPAIVISGYEQAAAAKEARAAAIKNNPKAKQKLLDDAAAARDMAAQLRQENGIEAAPVTEAAAPASEVKVPETRQELVDQVAPAADLSTDQVTAQVEAPIPAVKPAKAPAAQKPKAEVKPQPAPVQETAPAATPSAPYQQRVAESKAIQEGDQFDSPRGRVTVSDVSDPSTLVFKTAAGAEFRRGRGALEGFTRAAEQETPAAAAPVAPAPVKSAPPVKEKKAPAKKAEAPPAPPAEPAKAQEEAPAPAPVGTKVLRKKSGEVKTHEPPAELTELRERHKKVSSDLQDVKDEIAMHNEDLADTKLGLTATEIKDIKAKKAAAIERRADLVDEKASLEEELDKAGVRFHLKSDKSEDVKPNLGPHNRKERDDSPALAKIKQLRAVDTIKEHLDHVVGMDIYKSVDDLPPELQHVKRRIDAEEIGKEVEGFFDEKTGRIVLITDNISDSKRAQEVIRHELSHRGLKKILGKTSDKIEKALDSIYESHKADIDKLASKRELSDMHEATEEFIATHGQQWQNTLPLQRLFSVAREALRKMGFDIAWSNSDIMHLANMSVRKGGAVAEGVDGSSESRMAVRENQGDYEYKKNKDGSYVGGPHYIDSPAKLRKAKEWLVQLAKEGEARKMWYEDSGEAIKGIVKNDPDAAHKFAEILAIYSPQQGVKGNATIALRVWDEFARTGNVTTGTKAQQEKALKVFKDQHDWAGTKTSTFMSNLMAAVDPRFHPESFKHGVTVDMWMYRALGYKSDTGTGAGSYPFVERMVSDVAKQLGWEPHQAQAAIWSAIKARQTKIDKDLFELAQKRGWIQRVAQNGSTSWAVKPEFAEKYADTRLRMSRATEIGPDELGKAGYNFGDALRPNMERAQAEHTYLGGNIEAAPDPRNTVDTERWERMSYDEKHKATVRTIDAVMPDLAEKHGLRLGKDVSVTYTQGSFVSDGEAYHNPSVWVRFNPFIKSPDIDSFMRDFHTVLEQQGTIAFNSFDVPKASISPAEMGKSGYRTHIVITDKAGEISPERYREIFDKLRAQAPDLVTGATHYGDSIVISDVAPDFVEGLQFQSSRMFVDKIAKAWEDSGIEGNFGIKSDVFKTTIIGGNYDGHNLRGQRQGVVSEKHRQGWYDTVRSKAREARFSGEESGVRFSTSTPGVGRPDIPGGERVRERGLPLREDGRVEVNHWGHTGGLEEIDPARYGSGIKGAEAKRKINDAPYWQDRSYFGIADGDRAYTKEPGLGSHKYTASFDPKELYDFAKDPDGLMAQAKEGVSTNITLYEKLIKEAGYKGYIVDSPSLGKVAAVFEKTMPERYLNEVTGEVGYDKRNRSDGVNSPVKNIGSSEGPGFQSERGGEEKSSKSQDGAISEKGSGAPTGVDGGVRLAEGSGQDQGIRPGERDESEIRFSLAPPKNSQEFKQWQGELKAISPSKWPKAFDRKTTDHVAKNSHLGAGVYLMFHGTADNFNVFRNKGGKGGWALDSHGRRALFFSPNAEWAAEYKFGNNKDAEDLAGGLTKLIESGASSRRIDEWMKDHSYQGQNVIPAWVKVSNPFQYWNPQHIDVLKQQVSWLDSLKMPDASGDTYQEAMEQGRWQAFNDPMIQDALKKMGFDSYFENEEAVYKTGKDGHQMNLAIFDPKAVKSVTGNVGSYGQRPVTGSEAKPLGLTADQANELQAKGDIRFSLRDTAAEADRRLASLSTFYEKDGRAALTDIGTILSETRKSFQNTFTAPGIDDQAGLSARVIREHNSKRAQFVDRIEKQYEEARVLIDKLPGTLEDPHGIKVRFIDAIQRGEVNTLPQSLQGIARDIMKTNDRLLAMVQERGRLENTLSSAEREAENQGLGADDPDFIAYYFSGMWAKKDQDRAQQMAMEMLGSKPLDGKKSFLKAKSYAFFKDGLDAGLTPLYDNPIDMLHHNASQVARWVMGHDIIKEYKQLGLVKFVPAEYSAPSGWKAVDDPSFTVHGPTDESGVRIVGRYYMPEGAAKVMGNFVSRGLRSHAGFRAYLGAANVMNSVQLGFSFFHAGFTSFDANISQFALGIHYLAHKDLLSAGKAFASTPTAFITNAMLGNKLVKAWNDPTLDIDGVTNYKGYNLADVYALAGGRARMDGFYRIGIINGFKTALRQGNKIGAALRAPMAGIEMLAKPIMEHLVPAQKAGVFAKLAMMEIDKAERAGTPLTHDQLRQKMGKAVDSVDNRLGQMVYDNLFWKKTAKDLAMASVRSVGWNLGTIREVVGGGKDWGKFISAKATGKNAELTTRMSYVVALPIVTGMAGAIINYLFTGEGPQELKDYFFPKTGGQDERGNPERISLPTYMKDIYHYGEGFKHPEELAKLGKAKIHPLLSTIADMFDNQDYYGNEIFGEDDDLVKRAAKAAGYTGKQMIPFAVSGSKKMLDRGDSVAKAAGNFVGFAAAPNRVNMTEAEKLMAKYADANKAVGGRGEVEAKAMEAKQEVRMALRRGDVAEAKKLIGTAISQRVLTNKDLVNMIKTMNAPAGTERFKRLNLHQAVKVINVATPKERALFAPLLAKKLQSDNAIKYLDDIKQLDLNND